jgi:hypothetical protein
LRRQAGHGCSGLAYAGGAAPSPTCSPTGAVGAGPFLGIIVPEAHPN